MSAAFVQSWRTSSAAQVASYSLAIGGATANNLLVATVATRGNLTGLSVSVNAGWTIATQALGLRTSNILIYKVAGGSNALDDLVLTVAGGTCRVQIWAVELSGLDPSSPYDGVATNAAYLANTNTAGVALSTGSVTPTTANGVAVFCLSVYDRSAWTIANPGNDITTTGTTYGKGGYGVANSRPFAMMAMRNYTSAVAQTESWNQRSDGSQANEFVGAMVAVFKEAGGGGGGFQASWAKNANQILQVGL